MNGSEPDLRRTSRVRKTPTKFTQDYDVLDGSPTPRSWDEVGLRSFYDGIVQHGPGHFRRIAQACGRSTTMCEDMYSMHKQFLGAINADNADAMWQYFKSVVNLSAALPSTNTRHEGGTTPVNTTPGGARGGKAGGRGVGRTPVNAATTPDAHTLSGGKPSTKRTPRRAGDASGAGVASPAHDMNQEARAIPTTRKRRLDFTNITEGSPALAFATAGDSPYTSKLDMLAAAASEAAGQVPTPAASDLSLPTVNTGTAADLENDPRHAAPYRTPRRAAAAAAAAAAARGRELSPDDNEAVNSPSVEVFGAAGGAGSRSKRLRAARDADIVVAIDLQRSRDEFRVLNGASYGDFNGAELDTHSHMHMPSGSNGSRQDQQGAGTGASQGHSDSVMRGSPERAACNSAANLMRSPLHAISLPPAVPLKPAPGSFRRALRKSPPERLPLHLLQHRSWLMNGCVGGPHGGGADSGAAPSSPEVRLRQCLSLRARRWALYEFLTAPIDRAFFSNGSMAEYLHTLGLSHVKKFSKADMSFIRTALGAPPRRLSPAFLRQERGALHLHRERCRRVYEQHAALDSVALPGGVPPQCVVGQHVVARHPVLRMLQDGAVLTVSDSTYMVQFHRSELGVAKVLDTDVVPVDSLVWSPAQPEAGAEVEPRESSMDAAQRDELSQRVRDKDFELMDNVADLVQRKEQMLAELKAILDEAHCGTQKLPDGSFHEDFQTQYANKVAEFKQVNEALTAACSALKARVDETSSPDAMLTRTLSAVAVSPAGSDEAVAAMATFIVEESMAEAAALVNDLFHEQRQKRVREMVDAAAAADAAKTAAAGSQSACPAAAMDVAMADLDGSKRDVLHAPDGVDAVSNAETSEGTKDLSVGRENDRPAVQGQLGSGMPSRDVAGSTAAGADVKLEESSCLEPESRKAGTGVAAGGAATLESPEKMALMMDDESLMHMSTKLTAMFIAIQRCAASGQDARTVQRALIKLVANLKPASHANTSQYQLITKNVGRLSVFLGAR